MTDNIVELNILRCEAHIGDLQRCLGEAKALLHVEARAYRDNEQSRYTPDQRKGIADTLESFCKVAEARLKKYG